VAGGGKGEERKQNEGLEDGVRRRRHEKRKEKGQAVNISKVIDQNDIFNWRGFTNRHQKI
jgi:hypothetical protein